MPRAKTAEERAAKLAAAHALQGHKQVAKGEQLALTHGAYSSWVCQPLVEVKLEAWLGDPDFPEYAKCLPQRFTLRSLARVEVRLELLYGWLEEMGLEESISEVQTTRETVRGGGVSGGTMQRKAKTFKRRDLDETVRRWEVHRLNLLKELGLTPMAQVRMGRDVAAARVDLARLIQDADAEDAQALQGRVLEAGE